MYLTLIEDILKVDSDNDVCLSETLEYLTEILDDITRDPRQFVDEARRELKEIALDHDLCPGCYEALTIDRAGESYVGTCHGAPAYETIYRVWCDACGYEEIS